jgi:8-oxo-dGTP pyrophosphatase MutT (NUDIX family)
MEQDRSTIAVPVPAAILILARYKAGELQVYLLKRNPRSGFMVGNTVFPGGIVDPGDGDNAWGARADLNLCTNPARDKAPKFLIGPAF